MSCTIGICSVLSSHSYTDALLPSPPALPALQVLTCSKTLLSSLRSYHAPALASAMQAASPTR
jgi:hypothetical protein